jgi:hypothetical protein
MGGGASLFARKDVEISTSRIIGADDDAEARPASEPAQSQPSTQQTPPSDVRGPVPSTPATQKQEEKKPSERRQEAEAAVKPEEKPTPKKKPIKPTAVPGAAFRAKINRDHFLSYGYNSDSIVVLMDGDAFFRPSKDGANVVTFTTDGALTVAGFIWPDDTEDLLRGTSFLIDEQMGRGHVIMFAEDPNFRFLWRTASQMFLNSVLLAPTLR